MPLFDFIGTFFDVFNNNIRCIEINRRQDAKHLKIGLITT